MSDSQVYDCCYYSSQISISIHFQVISSIFKAALDLKLLKNIDNRFYLQFTHFSNSILYNEFYLSTFCLLYLKFQFALQNLFSGHTDFYYNIQLHVNSSRNGNFFADYREILIIDY